MANHLPVAKQHMALHSKHARESWSECGGVTGRGINQDGSTKSKVSPSVCIQVTLILPSTGMSRASQFYIINILNRIHVMFTSLDTFNMPLSFVFLSILKRGGGVRETAKHQLVAYGMCPCNQRTKPATRASALTGNPTCRLLVYGTITYPMNHWPGHNTPFSC